MQEKRFLRPTNGKLEDGEDEECMGVLRSLMLLAVVMMLVLGVLRFAVVWYVSWSAVGLGESIGLRDGGVGRGGTAS